MWTKSFAAFLALTTGAALAAPAAAPAPATPVGCEFGRDRAIPDGSVFADQFRCYKTAGRKISIPGTSLSDGGLNGGGCIVGVALDRVQVANCNGWSDKSVTIPFASIQLLVDEATKDFVTVVFR
jgi:hypothetical protein